MAVFLLFSVLPKQSVIAERRMKNVNGNFKQNGQKKKSKLSGSANKLFSTSRWAIEGTTNETTRYCRLTINGFQGNWSLQYILAPICQLQRDARWANLWAGTRTVLFYSLWEMKAFLFLLQVSSIHTPTDTSGQLRHHLHGNVSSP